MIFSGTSTFILRNNMNAESFSIFNYFSFLPILSACLAYTCSGSVFLVLKVLLFWLAAIVSCWCVEEGGHLLGKSSEGPRRGTHHLYVSRVLPSARVAAAPSPSGGLSEVAGEPRSPACLTGRAWSPMLMQLPCSVSLQSLGSNSTYGCFFLIEVISLYFRVG